MAKKNNLLPWLLGLGGVVGLGVVVAVAMGDDDEPDSGSGSGSGCTEVERGEYRRTQFVIELCGTSYYGVVLLPMQSPIRTDGFVSAEAARDAVRAWVDSKLGPPTIVIEPGSLGTATLGGGG